MPLALLATARLPFYTPELIDFNCSEITHAFHVFVRMIVSACRWCISVKSVPFTDVNLLYIMLI